MYVVCICVYVCVYIYIHTYINNSRHPLFGGTRPSPSYFPDCLSHILCNHEYMCIYMHIHKCVNILHILHSAAMCCNIVSYVIYYAYTPPYFSFLCKLSWSSYIYIYIYIYIYNTCTHTRVMRSPQRALCTKSTIRGHTHTHIYTHIHTYIYCAQAEIQGTKNTVVA
jgi:hypothetical protein